ncbi:putative bifunctional diguanylate cyclase/phosphodiesterase [Salinispira pacifica]|uniref:Diguanylate cyclase/phosphodiesterase (GGDEF & EAL domains) with PAS/PAC sensor(S) n=1 Tax=Salinispira pacifica TaxID=1307761 RepID=V5WDS7_9SPIO|nr:EAL domain-containing protein [Salinispira pacifica]AHC13719.1 diguanylate cyclase/phosphodiesterase (GGDEF & EAL domains) with PAS/PAC sensor(s) [Salinispira pacifica]
MEIREIQAFIEGKDTDSNALRTQLAHLVKAHRVQAEREKKLKDELQGEKEENRRLIHLSSIHPDTMLPLYREYLKDMNILLEGLDPRVNSFALVHFMIKDHTDQQYSSYNVRKPLMFKTVMKLQDLLLQGETLYQGERLEDLILYVPALEKEEFLRDRLLTRFLPIISARHQTGSGELQFDCHMGMVRYPDHGTSLNELNSNLEFALQEAVREKQSLIQYNTDIGEIQRKNLIIQRDLRKEKEESFAGLELRYQPFVNSGNRVVGCESLVRWNHPEFGFISPEKFIRISEQTGDIKMLGRWILYQALQDLKRWLKAGLEDIYVSVNLSPVQFTHKGLSEEIIRMMKAIGLEGRYLKLEITEGAIMADPEESTMIIKNLQNYGIRIAIDDFGTGYSSLNYLMNLPINTLKLDKSFVDDVLNNSRNQEVVRSIINLGDSLGMELLAEGVESKDQKEYLFAQGVHYIQGYYYSAPVTSGEFETIIGDPDYFQDK